MIREEIFPDGLAITDKFIYNRLLRVPERQGVNMFNLNNRKTKKKIAAVIIIVVVLAMVLPMLSVYMY